MSSQITPTRVQDVPLFAIHGRPVKPWLVLVSLIFGLFMTMLDSTIVTIALPTIQGSLKTDLSTVSWVLNAYNLVFAVLLVTVGRFADQYGRKRVFLLAMAVFSLGSLCCATAQWLGTASGVPGIDWLIAARAMQAIGGAGLTPISLAIITAVFPPRSRGAAIGIWGALAGLAAAIGPVLGGFLVQNFDWTWIFFVNLPFCLIGLLLVWRFVPETRKADASKRIDLAGMLTLTAALFCLMLAIAEGIDWGWRSPAILTLLLGTLISAICFGLAEYVQRDKEPLVDFTLFKIPSFSGANITMFFFGISVQGAFLILILYFLNALSYGQLDAAYAFLPMSLALMVGAALLGRFSQKISPFLSGIIGMFFLAAGFILLCLLPFDASYLEFAGCMVLLGIAQGMLFQSQPSVALADIPRTKLGVSSGVFNTFRQIGFALGVAILTSVLVSQMTINMNQARGSALVMVQSDTGLPSTLRADILADLQKTTLTGSSSTDLTPLARQLPATTPNRSREAIKTNLRALSSRIAEAFKNQVVNAYKAAWWVAVGFALMGIISAMLTALARRKGLSF